MSTSSTGKMHLIRGLKNFGASWGKIGTLTRLLNCTSLLVKQVKEKTVYSTSLVVKWTSQ